jgi:hypothetical protein
MVVIVVAFATYLVSRLSGVTSQQRSAIERTVLAKAKEALIAYAVSYAETHANAVPGYLPCPDRGLGLASVEGSSSSCGSKNVSVIGRLPWRTLGLEALRDSAGECLWYALSGSHKSGSPTDMMNWDTTGQFRVLAADGTTLLAGAQGHTRAIAVILAPGSVQGAQDRTPALNAPTCGGNYNPAAYLDSDATSGTNNAQVSASAGAIDTYIAGSKTSSVNDALVFITPDDIFNALQKRADFMNSLRDLALATARCLADYGKNNAAGADDKRLPWAAPVALSDFLTNASYRDAANTFSGRAPYRAPTSKSATDNQMVGSGATLLKSATCSSWTQKHDTWYKNWKDHLFYALASDFKPSGGATSCGTCLKVNTAGTYAGVVLFAGRRLGSQIRETNADKSLIANYLEGRNSANHPNSAGNSNYENAASSAFNDVLYCIDQNLNVSVCP